MKIILKYADYVGLRSSGTEKVIVPEYRRTKSHETSKRYLSYLKELTSYHERRLDAIESKNSQLVGQAGIVISISALGIPLITNTLNNLNLIFLIPLLILFLATLFHYVLSVIHATRTLDISKYPYTTGSVSTIVGINRPKNEKDFVDEEIEDLIHGIVKNSYLTDLKGGNLLYSARSFKLASCLLASFISCVLISIVLLPKPDQTVLIRTEIDRKIDEELLKTRQDTLHNVADVKIQEPIGVTKGAINVTDSIGNISKWATKGKSTITYLKEKAAQ